MKVFLTTVVCLLVIGSIAFAEPSIWGYVYQDSVAVEGATVYINYDGGRWTTTNRSGYYVHAPIYEGTYWMEAYKGQYNDIKTDIEYGGGPGGLQVDFHLTYDPK